MCLDRYILSMGSNADDDPIDDFEWESVGKRFAEKLVPKRIKRVVDAGVEKLSGQPENLLHFVQELRVPKEVGSYLIAQIDETKNGLYRAVAHEIRGFLDHTNVADELTRALTKLSFEVRMVVRFVPNDVADGGLPRPDVQSEVTVKDNSKGKKTSQRAARPSKKRTK